MRVKVCSKLIHPEELKYFSKSHPGKVYTVVTPTIMNDEFCTCPGWQFREHCSHVEDALRNFVCDWHGPIEEFKDTNRCPQCGGPTEDFEMDSEWD